jgi:hypothetical protein
VSTVPSLRPCVHVDEWSPKDMEGLLIIGCPNFLYVLLSLARTHNTHKRSFVHLKSWPFALVGKPSHPFVAVSVIVLSSEAGNWNKS